MPQESMYAVMYEGSAALKDQYAACIMQNRVKTARLLKEFAFIEFAFIEFAFIEFAFKESAFMEFTFKEFAFMKFTLSPSHNMFGMRS